MGEGLQMSWRMELGPHGQLLRAVLLKGCRWVARVQFLPVELE